MNILLRSRFGLPPDPWAGHYLETADAERAAALVDAAVNHQALASIVGRSGSGKTRAIDQALASAAARVVEVQRLDRERLRLGDVTVALVRDLSEGRESPRHSGEARTGQVARLLGNAKQRVVLVVDDAHELHRATLRGLKRLHELRWLGRRHLLGILLVGETDTAATPSLDYRTAKLEFSGLSAAEVGTALRLAWGEVLHADAIERLAAAAAARNWFELHNLLDETLLEAVARREALVSAAAAAAAISRTERQSGETTAEQPDETVDDVLGRLKEAG